MPWWENETLKFRDGKLTIDGVPAETLARKYGTPVFVYSRRRLAANFDRLRASFAAVKGFEVRLCYAMKANPHSGILRRLKTAGAWIDAVSPREVLAARRAGFSGDRILFTGTSLGERDFRAVFDVPGVTVNIDAVEQIEAMREARPSRFKEGDIRVSVRWNPGLGRGFNPRVITAGTRSVDGTVIKFGVEEARVPEALELAAAAGFRTVGLHQHLGSGWTADDYPTVETAVERMIGLAREVVRTGTKLEFLDFGGGFGPRYMKTQKAFPVDRYARLIGRSVGRAGLGLRAIAVEPGKYLVADAGVLLLGVNYLKRSYENLLACVDGGTFNTLPRTAVYAQAYHEIVNASRSRGTRAAVTVAGHLCETGDVFGRDLPMVVPRSGEILAVLSAGAYGRSMASEFNLRPIAAEILR